jgi:hypothetical protein
MNARKQYGGGLAVFACLTIALAAVVLPSCGGGGGCSDNPAGPGCQPSPSPTPPPLVTRVVSQGSRSLETRFLTDVVFTTTASGTVGVEVNWTFASNDVDIYLTRGADPCTVEAFNNGTCAFIASSESTSLKPEKLTAPGLAAGTYTLYIGNLGPTDESVAYQVTLASTSASSVSSATTAPVPRGAAKGTFKRVIELP